MAVIKRILTRRFEGTNKIRTTKKQKDFNNFIATHL